MLGDGSAYGVRLRFVEEPEPRGTAGALKYAEPMLDERFLMLNGDVLTDIDLSAQIAQHEQTGATATLALVPVADPSAYGLVLSTRIASVREFSRSRARTQIDTNLISAGAYVLEREILELVPPDRNVSIEREVWPQLIGNGLYGFPAESYWLDIGTPERYLQGHLRHHRGQREDCRRRATRDGLAGDRRRTRRRAGASIPPAVLERGVDGRPGRPRRQPRRARRRRLGRRGSTIERSVVLTGAEIGAGCELRDCIVAPAAASATRSSVDGGAVLGEGVDHGG